MAKENFSEFDLEEIMSYTERSVEKKIVAKNDFYTEEDELGKYIRLKCCNKRYYTMLEYLDHREEVHGEMLETYENPCKFIRSYEAKPQNNRCYLNELPKYPPIKFAVDPLSFEEEIRPYKCEVMGCCKRYKNKNGLKYHMNHNHLN